MNKKYLIFLQPVYFNPCFPNFKDRFELLSENYRGVSFFFCNHVERFDEVRFGNFTCYGLANTSNKVKRYFFAIYRILKTVMRLKQDQKIDFIVCYDPLFYGFTGCLLKILTGGRLIIEVNGHLTTAGFLKEGGVKKKLKKFFFRNLISISFKNADAIKLLNFKQKEELQRFSTRAKIFSFKNFVPTHVFQRKDFGPKYILFIGHPFELKGIDVLIKGFLGIFGQFPDVKLKIVGHCHGGDAERRKYIDMTQGNPNIEILKPVYYDEAIKLFESCLFFVLPSRSEAMGRVLIEAMASGKPVIGSRVGGIPDVIEDGGNGFLFESGNVEDLEDKMLKLLKSKELRERMGARSLELVKEKFSSQKYIENFTRMIEGLNV